MNRLNNWKKILFFILIFFLLTTKNKAQDSLYLVGTITGVSADKNITNVKSIGDINGDGYDDFMVSTRSGNKIRGPGIVELYLGSVNGDLISDITFHYAAKDSLYNFGGVISGIGDINGDGYNDFAIGGNFGDWSGFPKGKVFVYLGGKTMDTIPKYEFYEPWIQDWFGQDIEGVGDINKDGFDDFIISSPYNWTNGMGYVYLFWGGDTISFGRCDTLKGYISGDQFGNSVTNIGDINNDGFDDIGIGAYASPPDSQAGKVYIYDGGKKINIEIDTILKGNFYYQNFGRIIRNGSDLNKDNKIEFFVTGSTYVYIYSRSDLLTVIDGDRLGFGGYLNVVAGCDINNDGYKDFIIGNTNYRNLDSIMVGGAFIYLGGEDLDTVYKYKLEGENKWGEYSLIMSHADINGDGYDELFILAPDYPDYQNPLGMVYIYSYKRITSIQDNKRNIPDNFKLYQNYPNPFNPSTIINYELSINSYVTIKIYDLLGKELVSLVNEVQSAGTHEIKFNTSKYNISSGIYFCQLSIKGEGSKRIKMVLIK